VIDGPWLGNLSKVDAYLEKQTPGNVIASSELVFGAGISVPGRFSATVFNGLSLTQDWYRLTIFTSDPTGRISWASCYGTTNTASGTYLYSEVAASSNTNLTHPYLSTFVQTNDRLAFTVTGVVVPEPSTGCMILFGVAMIGVGLRWRLA